MIDRSDSDEKEDYSADDNNVSPDSDDEEDIIEKNVQNYRNNKNNPNKNEVQKNDVQKNTRKAAERKKKVSAEKPVSSRNKKLKLRKK